MRRYLFPLIFALFLGPAFGQAPPAVPALPDTPRITSYSLSGTTCACSVGFQIYGDSTDIDSWIEVWLGNVRYLSTDPTFGWSLSSATGTLATIPRPITNAVLTFNSPQTGTVQIVGAMRPRRTAQFAENRGVAARDANQWLTYIIADLREFWDKLNDVSGRAIIGLPGETLTPLPPAATRAGKIASYDGSGNPTVTSPTIGAGNVIGPATSINGDVATFNGTAGTAIGDSGYKPTQPISCASHTWVVQLAATGILTCSQPAFTDISGQAALAQLPTIGANTALCSIAGGTPIACTTTQITTLIKIVTTTTSGAVPPIPGNTTTFFRGDGTYAAPQSSALVLLNTLMASNSATLSDTTSITNAYSSYEIVFLNVTPVTNATTLELQVHSGSFQVTSYVGAAFEWNSGGSSAISATTFIPLTNGSSVANTNPGVSGTISVYAPSLTTTPKMWTGNMAWNATSANPGGLMLNSYWNNNAAVDGFQILFSSGNLSTGTIKIYGRQ